MFLFNCTCLLTSVPSVYLIPFGYLGPTAYPALRAHLGWSPENLYILSCPLPTAAMPWDPTPNHLPQFPASSSFYPHGLLPIQQWALLSLPLQHSQPGIFSWHLLYSLLFLQGSLKVNHWSVSGGPVKIFVVMFRRWTRHFSLRKAEWDMWVVIHQLLLRPESRWLTLTSRRTEADPVKQSMAGSVLNGRTEYFPPSFVIDNHLSLKIGLRAHTSWALALGCTAPSPYCFCARTQCNGYKLECQAHGCTVSETRWALALSCLWHLLSWLHARRHTNRSNRLVKEIHYLKV